MDILNSLGQLDPWMILVFLFVIGGGIWFLERGISSGKVLGGMFMGPLRRLETKFDEWQKRIDDILSSDLRRINSLEGRMDHVEGRVDKLTSENTITLKTLLVMLDKNIGQASDDDIRNMTNEIRTYLIETGRETSNEKVDG